MPWWPGWGRGWRWCFWATGMPGWMRWGYPGYGYGFPSFAPSEEDELRWLEEEEKLLEEELEWVRKRIDELRRKSSE
ncbi:MAG: DUF5320 family protein [Archaeoglobus sp.]|nr:DUF5320 family protein [Archaeoglobus sp.]